MKSLICVLFIFGLLVLTQRGEAQWVQTDGPGLSTTTSIVSSGAFVFVATSDHGVFRSSDNGEQWERLTIGVGTQQITSLYILAGYLFAGTSDAVIFRSTNYGDNWFSSSTGIQRKGGQEVKAFANNAEYLFVGISGATIIGDTVVGGIYRSSNNGDSWTKTNYQSETMFALLDDGASLDVGGFSGVERSTDNGQTWFMMNTGLSVSSAVTALYKQNGIYLIGVDDYFGDSGIYRSTNNGQSWTWSNVGPRGGTSSFAEVAGTIYACGGPLYTSTDNGVTWTVKSAFSSSVSHVFNHNAMIIAGTEAGDMYRSADGGDNWLMITPSQLSPLGAYALYSTNNTLFAGTIYYGIYQTTNSGSSWFGRINSGLPPGSSVYSFASYGENLYAGTYAPGGVYRSTNNGVTWTNIGTNIGLGVFATVIRLAAHESVLYAMANNHVYRTTNSGASWDSPSLDIRAIVQKEAMLFSSTSSGVYSSTDDGATWQQTGFTSSATNLVATTSGIVVSSGNMIYRSVDNGQTWVPASTGLPNLAANAVVSFGDNLFACFLGESAFYVSTNLGDNWVAANQGLPANRVFSIAIHDGFVFATPPGPGIWRRPLSEMIAFVPIQLASFTAVRIENNRVRLHWSTISEINNYGFYVQRKEESAQEFTELPNTFIPGHGTTLEPHEYEFVDALSPGGQLQYRLRQVDLDGTSHLTGPVCVNSTTSVNENIPLRFALEQNYPNPFNPTTNINYQIPTSGHITLKVFDLLGREVATLVDEVQDAGSKSVEFNAGGLASGVYFYRLVAVNFMGTKKILLIR